MHVARILQSACNVLLMWHVSAFFFSPRLLHEMRFASFNKSQNKIYAIAYYMSEQHKFDESGTCVCMVPTKLGVISLHALLHVRSSKHSFVRCLFSCPFLEHMFNHQICLVDYAMDALDFTSDKLFDTSTSTDILIFTASNTFICGRM